MKVVMKCDDCGGELVVTREAWPHDESGLPGVVLDGIEVRRCPKCGTAEPVIPRIEGLHRWLASRVVLKHARLTAAEVKFLRKVLGFSGRDLAKHMDVAPETVSRWENGREQIGPTADRLLRTMAVIREPIQDYSIDELARIEDSAEPLRVRARPVNNGWTESAHAP